MCISCSAILIIERKRGGSSFSLLLKQGRCGVYEEVVESFVCFQVWKAGREQGISPTRVERECTVPRSDTVRLVSEKGAAPHCRI